LAIKKDKLIKTKKMKNWQGCPHCAGTGVEKIIQSCTTQNTVTIPKCTVCNGKKIINIFTGKPPKD